MVFAQVTVQSIVDATVQTTLYIVSGVVIIMWVITGALFLLAQGAPEKVNLAKKALFASVAGTVIVIVANYAIDLVGKAFGI